MSRTSAALAALLVLGACGENADTSRCEFEATAISDDQLTPGGFSVSDMLAVSTGTFAEQAVLVDGSQASLTIHSWRGDGTAELVRSTPRPGRLRDGIFRVSMMAVVCSDFVRVPLGVELTTPDGVVDLNMEGSLTRLLEPRGTFQVSLTESSMKVEPDEISPDFVLPEPLEHDPAEMDQIGAYARLAFGVDGRQGTVLWNGRWTSEQGSESESELLLSWGSSTAE